MSFEQINDAAPPQGDDPAGADLNDGVAGGEESFVVTEEKKAPNRTTMVLFLIIAIGGGGLYVMHLRTGPKSAAAAPQTAQANQTISQFLKSGSSNLLSMETMLRNTQKIVQQFLSYPSVSQVPLDQLHTNPFRTAAAKEGESNSQAVTRRQQEQEKVAIKRAAEGLQVQSILHGARRACMINNTMCMEGQQIEGFTVEKINPSSVVVKNGSYRFELQMQK